MFSAIVDCLFENSKIGEDLTVHILSLLRRKSLVSQRRETEHCSPRFPPSHHHINIVSVPRAGSLSLMPSKKALLCGNVTIL